MNKPTSNTTSCANGLARLKIFVVTENLGVHTLKRFMAKIRQILSGIVLQFRLTL